MYLRTERSHVIARAKRVRRYVCANSPEAESESSEKCDSPIVPSVNQCERVPKNFAIKARAGIGYSDTDEATERKYDGNDNELYILTV